MKSQRGLSLLEVLIAMVVMAFGLLGIAGLQTTALANNFIALQYTQSAMLGQNMLEKMRANPVAVANKQYDIAAGSTPTAPSRNCATESCTSAELAAWDLAVWYSTIAEGTSYSNVPAGPKGQLPGSKIAIICADTPCLASSTRLITIYWDADRTGASGLACNPSSSADAKCFRLAYVP